ncbi:MAG: response regulator transcription factor [Comamonadaceae bacterium]|nr:MAG: response regulator transcription factor [Comamonadaceae bacterium]
MISVVLCDDHAVVRRGIRETLNEAVDIRVIGEAGSYAEVRELLRGVTADVLLLDLAMPGRGGMEVLGTLVEAKSPVRVLVVSMFPEDQYAIRCLRAGAHGYVSKSGDPQQLIVATRTVAQGRKYVTPEVAQMLADNVSRPADDMSHAELSERELQTLVKIASGMRLSDIAQEMMLSPKTVSVYRARLMEKLQLGSNAALTVYAIRNNLV